MDKTNQIVHSKLHGICLMQNILTLSLTFFPSQTVKKAAPTEPTPQKVPKAKEEKVRRK